MENNKMEELKIDKAKTLGYIHDIGKGIGESHNHDINI